MTVTLCLCAHCVVNDDVVSSQSLQCIVEMTSQDSIVPPVSHDHIKIILVFIGWDRRFLFIFGFPEPKKTGVFGGFPFRNDIDQFLIYDASDFKCFRLDKDVRCVEIAMVEGKGVFCFFFTKDDR